MCGAWVSVVLIQFALCCLLCIGVFGVFRYALVGFDVLCVVWVWFVLICVPWLCCAAVVDLFDVFDSAWLVRFVLFCWCVLLCVVCDWFGLCVCWCAPLCVLVSAGALLSCTPL